MPITSPKIIPDKSGTAELRVSQRSTNAFQFSSPLRSSRLFSASRKSAAGELRGYQLSKRPALNLSTASSPSPRHFPGTLPLIQTSPFTDAWSGQQNPSPGGILPQLFG